MTCRELLAIVRTVSQFRYYLCGLPFWVLQVKDGVLQRAWKEPATEEERWQVVVPRALRDSVLN